MHQAETKTNVADKTPAKTRGRKKADYATVQSEAQALRPTGSGQKESGVYKPDFAKQEKMTVKQFDALLDRVRQRKRRSDKCADNRSDIYVREKNVSPLSAARRHIAPANLSDGIAR